MRKLTDTEREEIEETQGESLEAGEYWCWANDERVDDGEFFTGYASPQRAAEALVRYSGWSVDESDGARVLALDRHGDVREYKIRIKMAVTATEITK